uniref:Uncharacterized protein n=1 Tax=viral metagenome TaxID=1070528 RepID=A0A6M3IX05_9ZZZZ
MKSSDNNRGREGVRAIINYDEDRVQILFDAKPDTDTIADLKGSGWHWSRFNGAWQRKHTTSAVWAAKRILGNIKPEGV